MASSKQEHDGLYRVYIVEIASRWHDLVAPGLPDGKRCFYVGETGRTVEERYREHRTGTVLSGRKAKRSAGVFAKLLAENNGEPLQRKRDVDLRRTLMARYQPQPTSDESQELERQVIDDLRSEGHCVYPKDRLRPHKFDFKAYREFSSELAH